jgi:ABC-type uncharacterized transport system permease subunit
MGPVTLVAFYLGVVAYSAAATLFFVDLARADPALAAGRWGARALLAAVIVHAVHLAAGLAEGVVTAWSLQFALSLCACSVAAGYLVFRLRARIDAIGVVVAPIALTFLVGAQFLRASGPVTDFPRALLFMHVAANVLGVGFFLLAGAAGAFYLFQERRLKEKRVTSLHGRLPPLDALDLTEHRLLLAGFPLLTFGIVSGAVFASHIDAMTGASVARALLAYATWILVAAVLVLRVVAGWRGRRAAYGTLAGVACVLLVIGIYVANSGGGGGL